MNRNSCRILLESLKQEGLLCRRRVGSELASDAFDVSDDYERCMEFINHDSFHVHTRNAILMILMPRQLHVDDESQAAFLRAAVSRVRKLTLKINNYFYQKLANQTIIDREGVFYLERVWYLFHIGLHLKGFPISVTYKTYYNNHHPDYKTKWATFFVPQCLLFSKFITPCRRSSCE